MEIKGMTAWDLVYTPLLLLIIYIFLVIYRIRRPKDLLVRRYLIPALTVRFIGCISLGLVYQFYYKGGDTNNFYRDSLIITDAFFEEPWVWLKMYFIKAGDFYSDTYVYTSKLYFFIDPSSYFVEKLAGFLNIFTLSTYTGTAIFFSLISFSGAWAMFTSLCKIYPHMHKQIAIAVLFVPSVFFWGSGIMKDTISLSALGWLFHGCYELFQGDKSKRKRYIIILLISGYILIKVKIYIMICFLPAIIIWLFLTFSKSIKSKATRNFIKPILIVTSTAAGLYSANLIAQNDNRYKLENLAFTSMSTASYIGQVSKMEGGSFYDLGTIELTFEGILRIIPQGIAVTLFRPFPWESKNIIMILSSIESSVILLVSLLSVIRRGPLGTLQQINQNPYIFFALTFSIVFAFSIGVSTNNFGTLVRYKIPLIPFYLSAILLLKNNKPVPS